MKSALENKKIVLFAAETIPSFAGSARHSFQVAEHLTSLKANCRIACYNYNNRLLKKECVNGVEIRRMAYFNKNILFKIISVPNLIRHYFFEVLKCDLVIIYGRYLIGYFLIILFALLFKKKIVFQSTLLGCDDIESIKKRSKFLWATQKHLFSKIDCYWAINESFGSKWLNTIGKANKMVVAPQGVSLKKFYFRSSFQSTSFSKNQPLQILSCGILIERKGYRQIFDALTKLKIPFKYTIVGQHNPDTAHRSSACEKKEMETLFSLGKSLLGDKISFIGTSENVIDYYHKSDLLIHGAQVEGTPNVILEAMASGIPVVCHKLDGLAGNLLIHKKNYLDFSNNEELIEILNNFRYTSDATSKICLEAYNIIKSNYSFEKTMLKLVECLMSKRK